MLSKVKTTAYDGIPNVNGSISIDFWNTSTTTIYDGTPPFVANWKAIFKLRLYCNTWASIDLRSEIVLIHNSKIYKGVCWPLNYWKYKQWVEVSIPFDYFIGNVKITQTPNTSYSGISYSGEYYINFYWKDTHQLKPIVLNNIWEFNTPYSFWRLPTGERRDGN